MFLIKEVKTGKEVKQFVHFPFDLYKGDQFWVPPLIKDEIRQMNAETNPSMEFCEARYWTAWKDNKLEGRIAGIINPEYNKKTGEKKGRISKVEFIDDPIVSAALFQVAENWFREKGMTAVHGPLGFNNLDTQGLLIEGFDHLPSIASVYHKSYYQKHFEDLGYTKENDWVEFRLTLGEHALAKAKRGAELIKKRYGFEVLKFTSTEELKKYVQPVFNILNNAFQYLPYVTPFNSKMIEQVGAKYFKILNPKFVKIIRKDDRIIAFIFGLPSLSLAMQKAGGKLFPFGFYHLLKALKKPVVIDLLLTGVDPEFHTTGAAVLLFAELQDEMMKHGITQMETTGMFESNHTAISNWKNFDHIQHKRRRCFVKSL
jgi:hypothetical protein